MAILERCGEHAGGSVGAHPIGSTRQGTDVRGLSSTGYLHKIPVMFCYSSDGFRSFLCKQKRTKPKHPSLPLVSPRVAGCARMDTSAEDRPEHLGVETHTTFTIFGRKAHTSTIVTNERSNPRAFLSAYSVRFALCKHSEAKHR